MRWIAVSYPLLFLLGTAGVGQNQKPQAAPVQTAKQKPQPGFVDRVLKYLGISDSPTLKGPGDEIVSGSLFVVDLSSRASHAVGSGADFRSPIFLPEGTDILALRGSDVVRVSTGSGETNKLFTVPGIFKLVGASADDPDSVLILQLNESGARPRVGLLSVRTGKVTALAYDAGSSADLQTVESLEGWTRTYGSKQVYVRRQTKQTLSGVVEWNDVFLKADGQEVVDISQCNGTNCGQPSLSADGRFLAFVKGKPE